MTDKKRNAEKMKETQNEAGTKRRRK